MKSKLIFILLSVFFCLATMIKSYAERNPSKGLVRPEFYKVRGFIKQQGDTVRVMTAKNTYIVPKIEFFKLNNLESSSSVRESEYRIPTRKLKIEKTDGAEIQK